MILVKDKDLVVPGEILAEDDYHAGRGTFKEGNKICSSVVGLVALRNKKISVIPLQSKYVPKRGDVVIGEITDIRFSMWGLDINSPYSGLLPASEVFGKEKRELEKVFNIGDVLFLRVIDVDEVKKVKLGLKGRGLGKFKGGILINITPTKVPRLIGKKGSMINMIKDKTRCDIVVGQNGVVWVKGQIDMERIAEKVINMIEEQAHTSGLTDRVRDLLAELTGEKIESEVLESDKIEPKEETEILESQEEQETSETSETSESSEIPEKSESLDKPETQESSETTESKDESVVTEKSEEIEEQSEEQKESDESESSKENVKEETDSEENVSDDEGDKEEETSEEETDSDDESESSPEDNSKDEEKKLNRNLPRELIESKLNFIKR